jgi:MerR family transcriptional regulator, repressor of the yfmOP operon
VNPAASPALDPAGNDRTPRYRIGEVAEHAGVSTRTLRYYQELGLLDPAGCSPGGSRRYSDRDVARLKRILELRNVMGFDLDHIGPILAAEDRLEELRAEFHRGVSRKRHEEVLTEAMAINQGMRRKVQEKMGILSSFLAELEAKADRYRTVARELGMELPDDAAVPEPSPAAPVPTRAR